MISSNSEKTYRTAIQNTWYVETDHLGSIIGLLRSDKSYAEKLSFDAWGRRRNPLTWTYQGFSTPTLTDRGFTGHACPPEPGRRRACPPELGRRWEHLDWAGLINMNGRMYDPVIGRFLGVDPIVAEGDNSQSFNSYTYALNNPLRLIDRDGFKYEDAYAGGPIVASISQCSFDTWRAMKDLAKKGYEYSDCVGIATGYQDELAVLIQRQEQQKYGHSSAGDYTSKLYSKDGFNKIINACFEGGKWKYERLGFITSKGIVVLPGSGKGWTNTSRDCGPSLGAGINAGIINGNSITVNGSALTILGSIHIHPSCDQLVAIGEIEKQFCNELTVGPSGYDGSSLSRYGNYFVYDFNSPSVIYQGRGQYGNSNYGRRTLPSNINFTNYLGW